MKAKLLRFVLAGLVASLGVSCTTAYDAYGYPQQVVDPGVAIAGAAAAGLLAYGLASSNNNDCYRGYHRPIYRGCDDGFYRHGGYRGGYRGAYWGNPGNCW
jgi:hypothetical protein